jgi:hypothetical protein
MPLPYVGFRMSTHETDSIDTSWQPSMAAMSRVAI